MAKLPTGNVTSKHELGKPCAASAFWRSVAAALASESDGAGRAGVRAAGATRVVRADGIHRAKLNPWMVENFKKLNLLEIRLVLGCIEAKVCK